MSDDTRDIAIQTRADVKHLSEQLATVISSLETLKADLAERRGAERLARALHTLFAGAVGAGAVKLVSWISALPK